MDLYAENILDHARHPHRKTLLKQPTIERREINASCGDDLTVQLKVKDGIVTEAGWTGEGCAISQAAMSMLSEELIGKTVRGLEKLKPKAVLDLLGVDVGPRRLKCALLSLHASKNALHALRREPAQGWADTLGKS
jgi:nitrogen fixation NifU-like protein